MIKLTRLDGRKFVVNAELIESVEARPDTHLTLSNERHFVVLESVDDVVERVIDYRQRAYGRRLLLAARPGADTP